MSAFASTAAGALDHAVIARYQQLSAGFLDRLIKAYLDHAPTSLGMLRKAQSQQDFPSIKSAAHTLKSSSANLGAMRLADLCQKVEQAAHAQDSSVLPDLMQKIGVEYFSVEEALKTLKLQMTRGNT
jgi:HPt (histidine-containing phosphotransfer) domain-containing protein